MRKRFTFFVPALLFVGALFAPAVHAAEKIEISATEAFDPFGMVGDPVGYFVTMPTVKCPGHEPTGDPMQPCPPGSRIHLRGTVLVSRVESADELMGGWMTVEMNSNMDANATGPVWGTFSTVIDGGGTWEGTWQGLREYEDGVWTATLHVSGKGYGGLVDGMKLMAEDEIVAYTPTAVVYFGAIHGYILDPK